MTLNATFIGKTDEKRVKNHEEAYIAVWKPYNINTLYIGCAIKCNPGFYEWNAI